jgi:molybdopterin converting factor subunit 1
MRFQPEEVVAAQVLVPVVLFARARDLHGNQVAHVSAPASPTVGQLRARLAEQVPALGPLLQVSRVAVNHDFADDSQVINPGDEVAVIPPVSGG